MNSIINKYPSQQSQNHFGNCMVASEGLGVGVIVQQFLTRINDKAFKGDLAAPLEERHVIVIGKDRSGQYVYGRVLSDAKYINHSCDPNCVVGNDGVIRTLKPVNQLDELTIGYDVRWGVSGKWEKEWNFDCLCLAQNCRKLIDSYKN